MIEFEKRDMDGPRVSESQSLRLIKDIRSSLMSLSLFEPRLLDFIRYSAILLAKNVLLHPDCPWIQATGLKVYNVWYFTKMYFLTSCMFLNPNIFLFKFE